MSLPLGRTIRLVLLGAGVLLATLAGSVPAATFTVTTTANSGPGSLREAIASANGAGAGPHRIEFDIPPLDGTVKTIVLATALPTVTQAIVIDGYTQDDAQTNTLADADNAVLLVELTSTNQVANVLTITAGRSTVRGLVFNGFSNAIFLQQGGGNVVEGNFVGPAPAGTGVGPRRNSVGVTLTSTNNTIGGLSPGARNIIAGNTGIGLHIAGAGASNNVVLGNFIGIDATGAGVLGNGAEGIVLQFGAATNTIGGLTAAARNVIGGNAGHGVRLSGPRNVVLGNFIGLDATGAQALGNGDDGVFIEESSNVVGGVTVAARNVIAGNVTSGVEVYAGEQNRVQGNYLGTDGTGAQSRANGVGGVYIRSARNTVGGLAATPGTPPGNLLSGNLANGVHLDTTGAVANVIQGNLVGTDASGTLPLGNHNLGVLVTAAPSNTIGGVALGAGNVIAANDSGGITVADHGGAGTVIQGNWIGTDATATQDLGNGGPGILLGSGFALGPADVVIGGAVGNLIAFNAGAGVAADYGANNPITGNEFFANTGLGIDLDPAGATPNDACDEDSGANNGQNYPVLILATNTPAGLLVEGVLVSAPLTTFGLEFFVNTACDPSGFGEGETFLGATNLTTAANCTNQFVVLFPTTVPLGAFITATATAPTRDTSEFAACVAVTAGGAAGCTVACPGEITVPNDPGQCSAVVHYPAPITGGTCPAVVTDPPSGTTFPVGTTTVTARTGGVTACSFTVTVADTEPPAITCPADIVTNLPAGASAVAVSFGLAITYDNCAIAATNYTPASGSAFAAGTNTVTGTVFDSSGLTNTCSFRVIVHPAAPNQPPVARCRNVTNVAPANCQAVVTAAQVDDASSDPDGDPITLSLSPPGPYPAGDTAVTLVVADNHGGTNTCAATVTVVDQTPPTIVCPSAIVTNLPAGVTNAVVSFPAPIVTDNCAIASTNAVPSSGSVFGLGTNLVLWTVADAAANTNSCVFPVIVLAGPVQTNTPPATNDLAIIKLKAPKSSKRSAGAPARAGTVTVTIQNRSPHPETITSLDGLVTLIVESLGTNCPNATVALIAGPPNKPLPLVLKPKGKLNVSFSVTYDCVNDPLAGPGHADFRYTAAVHHEAIDGQPDIHPACDTCPRPPLPGGVDLYPDGKLKDKGCGAKTPAGTLGGDVLTDVVVKP